MTSRFRTPPSGSHISVLHATAPQAEHGMEQYTEFWQTFQAEFRLPCNMWQGLLRIGMWGELPGQGWYFRTLHVHPGRRFASLYGWVDWRILWQGYDKFFMFTKYQNSPFLSIVMWNDVLVFKNDQLFAATHNLWVSLNKHRSRVGLYNDIAYQFKKYPNLLKIICRNAILGRYICGFTINSFWHLFIKLSLMNTELMSFTCP